VLHLQLLAEDARHPQSSSDPTRHMQAMRDAIARVDGLLKAFSDLAAPAHLKPDLGIAISSVLLLFGHEARRGNIDLLRVGPSSLPVQAAPEAFLDLVCHAFFAGVALAREGTLRIAVEADGPRARLELRAEGGVPRREEAALHLEAMRRLSSEAGAVLSIDAAPAAPARLSLSFTHPR
jgi:hypothetical protein